MFKDQSPLVKLIWAALAFFAAYALISGRWELAFVAIVTGLLSLVPIALARWVQIEMPRIFIVISTAFIGGTLFLGEAFDFYNRFWWWDILLHGGSAMVFGLTGFVLVFMMFQGNRFAAPHIAIAFFAFCFAMTIGAMWEVFEFSMDQTIGTNMQKSGLVDTMTDLIVDAIGAFIGASSGYGYLKGRDYGGLGGLIEDFVARNPQLFRNWRK
ncbi:hypothetical protein DI396_00285 [Litorivita pollutaquae]|uniref:Membrane-spanning protein n=1 Tax=Litorivita pollutaquae TaxID=2200892 RepID=A0A2V4MV92_9RHOB|nr:hypothetical protein [Litorivita pollutaquae]OUS20948.1 hypothetical protein A9Q95_11975 [Rhodobacterales bacterium 59_46_T64]PYC49349.1 hypothetical protein DI396_00285 [Litorivita pollutaquae]